MIVLRHMGTMIALNDSLWEKYGLGERAKLNDPETKKPTTRNLFVRANATGKDALVPPEATIEGLLASGAVILACNKASMHLATQMAEKQKRDVEEVKAEVRAGIVPGVLLQPSGIYATLRAQDVGCSFIKST